ncbi:Leo1-domain-containing protein, partial [Serendipita vermifera]
NEADVLSEEERRKRRALEYEEDEDAPEPSRLPGIEKDYTLQNLGIPRSSDGNFWMLRLPHFLKYEHRPFHPDSFQALSEKDVATAANFDHSLSIKLELANTIRWKWITREDGTLAKQSNARVIRWDDGTMSIQLGNEMYDINTTMEQQSSQQADSQSQPHSQSMGSSRAQGVSYLVSQHRNEGLLQVEAPITGTMSLRPVGTQSHVHRQLVKAVAQKHTKVSKLRFASESMLLAAEKEQEALRKKGPKSRLPGASSGARRRRRVSAFERRRRGEYSDDDSMDGDTRMPNRGYDAAGAEAKKGVGEYEEDEFLVADSDEDDFEVPDKRRRSKRRDEEEELGGKDALDVLDEADARIERLAARAKSRDEDEDEEMGDGDQDDEEEEEEANAIRKSFGKRKLGRIADSDED